LHPETNQILNKPTEITPKSRPAEKLKIAALKNQLNEPLNPNLEKIYFKNLKCPNPEKLKIQSEKIQIRKNQSESKIQSRNHPIIL